MKEKIIEKLKNMGWGVLGILFLIIVFVVPILFVEGSIWIFAWLADHQIIEWINSIIFMLLLLLLFFSIFPRLRLFTGQGIVFLTYISGAIVWLLCLYITYILWGFLGVIVGLIFLGVGVFPTAVLALLFDGQFLVALFIAISLAVIYGLRMLGIWISTKYRSGSGITNYHLYLIIPAIILIALIAFTIDSYRSRNEATTFTCKFSEITAQSVAEIAGEGTYDTEIINQLNNETPYCSELCEEELKNARLYSDEWYTSNENRELCKKAGIILPK